MQEAQRTTDRINTKGSIARHIIFKLQKIKDKEKFLKEPKGKHPMYTGARIRITSDISLKPCKQEKSEAKYLKY